MSAFTRRLIAVTRLGWPAAILLSAAVLATWIPDFMQADAAGENATLVRLSVTMALAVLNGGCLVWLFYHTALTRYRIGLPLLLYLIPLSAVTALHTCWQGQLFVLLFYPVLLLLVQMRNRTDAAEEAFLAALLLAGGSWLVPEALCMLPVLWGGMLLQRAFSLRTLLATLIAVALVALYGTLAVLVLGAAHPYDSLLTRLLFWTTMTTADWVMLAVTMVLAVWALTCLLMRIGYASAQVQHLTSLFVLVAVASALFLIWAPAATVMLPVLLFALSALFALTFTQHESLPRAILFLLLLTAFLTAFFATLFV